MHHQFEQCNYSVDLSSMKLLWLLLHFNTIYVIIIYVYYSMLHVYMYMYTKLK